MNPEKNTRRKKEKKTHTNNDGMTDSTIIPKDSIPEAQTTIPEIYSRIEELEAHWDDLNKRQSWQEQIHRNVLENGNITHYYNIIPTVVISTITGFIIATIILKSRDYGTIARKIG